MTITNLKILKRKRIIDVLVLLIVSCSLLSCKGQNKIISCYEGGDLKSKKILWLMTKNRFVYFKDSTLCQGNYSEKKDTIILQSEIQSEILNIQINEKRKEELEKRSIKYINIVDKNSNPVFDNRFYIEVNGTKYKTSSTNWNFENGICNIILNGDVQIKNFRIIDSTTNFTSKMLFLKDSLSNSITVKLDIDGFMLDAKGPGYLFLTNYKLIRKNESLLGIDNKNSYLISKKEEYLQEYRELLKNLLEKQNTRYRYLIMRKIYN